jgi:hypothetical protein
MFLVSPELQQHVQEKTAHHDHTCKNDDRHDGRMLGHAGAFIAVLR